MAKVDVKTMNEAALKTYYEGLGGRGRTGEPENEGISFHAIADDMADFVAADDYIGLVDLKSESK